MERITADTATMESSTDYFLQKVYSSLTNDLPMQTLNTSMLSAFVNPQNIDRMVEMEMKRIKENCSRKEQQYVEQMLLENPITIERRTIVNRHQAPPQQQQHNHHHPYSTDVSAVVRTDNNTLLPIDEQQQQLQQQRAEACRRSRHNNKIKKAKTKYRHKYMSQKLLQSTQMYDCIQNLIAQAETHLLAQGLSQDKLQQLRHGYGMKRSRDSIRQMEHIMRTEQ